jgi:hypothetical protein
VVGVVRAPERPRRVAEVVQRVEVGQPLAQLAGERLGLRIEPLRLVARAMIARLLPDRAQQAQQLHGVAQLARQRQGGAPIARRLGLAVRGTGGADEVAQRPQLRAAIAQRVRRLALRGAHLG